MFSRITGLFAVSALALAACTAEDTSESAMAEEMAAPAAPTASADEVLADVVAAMGAGDLDSITFSGRAWRIRNSWMQTPTANPPWPWRDEITNYQRTIDLSAGVSQARGETFAQDLFLNPPTAGNYTQNVSTESGGWSQQLEYYLTPWGFLAGASANGVELSSGMLDGVEYQVLTWQSPEDVTSPSGMRYTVNGYIDDANRVAGVETWVDDAFMGDFHVVQVYGNYREEDGVMVPQTIEQQRGNGGVFGVIVADADANPSNLSELISAQGGGGRGGFGGGFGGGGGNTDPADLVEEIGDGAWIVTGAYTSLVVEFEDHLMVFEAGMAESLGETILAAIDAALPDKPIRYLVNSHPHSDHTGGIVPFMRRGITLITHENNVEFMDMALNTPRTLLGEDDLNVTVEGVSGVGVYEDSMNRLELHSVPNRHTDGMLVAVLPEQGVMFQADFTLPTAGAEPNEYVVGLAEYVAENDIQFDTYLAVHAASVPQSRDDLLATIGQ